MLVDLHMHTVYSDGVYSPSDVVAMAINSGVDVISITDHDTIDAYTDELYSYAKSKNIKITKKIIKE